MNKFLEEYRRSICMRTAHTGDKRNEWGKTSKSREGSGLTGNAGHRVAWSPGFDS